MACFCFLSKPELMVRVRKSHISFSLGHPVYPKIFYFSVLLRNFWTKDWRVLDTNIILLKLYNGRCWYSVTISSNWILVRCVSWENSNSIHFFVLDNLYGVIIFALHHILAVNIVRHALLDVLWSLPPLLPTSLNLLLQ